MKNPIPLYTAVLTSIGCHIDSQGLISQSISGSDPVPIDIDGRRLVLPLPEVLQSLDNSKYIAFHPLAENITMGNSPVIERFRRMVQMCIATRMSTITYELLATIVETKPEDLAGQILGLAEQVPDAKASTLKALEKVLQSLNNVDRAPIRIFLKRTSELNGEKFRREASVVFPLMEEFAEGKPDNYIYDVKMTKGDKNTLRTLFNIIMPNSEKLNAYSIGSNATVAPSFDALIRATHKLCTEIGGRAYHYRKYLEISNYRTDLSWGDADLNLAEYANYIPNLDGNDGTIINGQQGVMVNSNGTVVQQVASAATTPAAIGAYGMNNGVPVQQNPGVPVTATPPSSTPFRGLGQAPSPQEQAKNASLGQAPNTGMRVAQPNNPSIFANPPGTVPGMAPMGMPGMMPGIPGMMPGMPGMMPGMMPPMGMPGMMPGMPGMGMPGMMPPMMPQMMGQGLGQAPFPTAQPQQVLGQPQMMQPMAPQQMIPQHVMQPQMMPQMMQPQMMMNPYGMQQPQAGGGLFKRVQ